MGRHCCTALLSIVWSIHVASAGSHTHYFYTTVTNQTELGIPFYFTTRELDDVSLYWYDSQNQLLELRAAWFKSTYRNLWLENYGIIINQDRMLNYTQRIMNHLNQTDEYHVLQRIEGCRLYDNGTVEAGARDAYDMKPFRTFNVNTANWTADTPEAQDFVDLSNMNRTISESNRKLLQETCASHIKKLLPLGNCTFNRREKPNVIVTPRSVSNDTRKLHCRAYGHYPKNISMTWERNGQQVAEEELERITLPLPDLTYLTTLSINISPLEGNSYTCLVSHSSLDLPLSLQWKSSDDSQALYRGPSIGAVIAICLAFVVLVAAVVFGLVAWKKSRKYGERL
ncbi:major histocompatibility complex class I-related gene protein-like [Rhinophrynus dorsalis]